MGFIPSPRKLAADFHRDVEVPGWRGVDLPPEGKLIYEGRQKEFLDYLIGLARRHAESRRQVIGQIKDEPSLLRRGQMARKILRHVQGLGKLPERTALNAVARPAFVRTGYRVEHIIFESRPRFFVTANLYLPNDFKPPFPAVLYVLGHAPEGKQRYQRLPANLAMKGIAALVVDPAGQGERDEYADIASGQRTVSRACPQHAVAGDPAYLVGTNFGAYRLWDCMRCVDYLQSRSDIQGRRIGVSGTSGGGWEALWLGAIDPRIAAINVNCYTTTFLRRMENRAADAEPDPEQDPFGLLAAGLEAADLLLACFPRPVSIGATIRDFFPIDGALACYTEARALYAMAGKVDRVAVTVSDAAHENTLEMRRQTYRWMLKWLKNEPNPDDSEAPEWTNEEAEVINCTPSGIVLTSLGGKISAQFNAEMARELALERRENQAKPNWLGAIPKKLRELLYLPDNEKMGDVKVIAEHRVGKIAVESLQMPLSCGVTLDGHLWKPAGGGRHPAVVYISPKAKNYDPLKNVLCRRLAGDGHVVLDFDPRGMGPMDEAFQKYAPLIEGAFTYDGFLLGRPVLGMRVADVLGAVRFLSERENVDADQIVVHGHDYGALLALFAGCIDPRISAVVEERGLTSYSSVCWNRSYAWPANVVLPDVLKFMDLEDIRAAIAPRKLTAIKPLDHLKRPLAAEQAREEFALVRRAYQRARAAKNVSVLT